MECVRATRYDGVKNRRGALRMEAGGKNWMVRRRATGEMIPVLSGLNLNPNLKIQKTTNMWWVWLLEKRKF